MASAGGASQPAPPPLRPPPYAPDAPLFEKLYWYWRMPDRPSEHLDTPSEMFTWMKQVTMAVATGMLLGSYVGAVDGRKRAISALTTQQPPPDKETARTFVLRSMARTSSTKAVMMGTYLGGFVGLYTGVQHVLSWHRQQYDFLNHTAAGTVTGSVFGAMAGLGGIPYGAAVGAGLGLVTGLLWEVAKPWVPKEVLLPAPVPAPIPPPLPDNLGELIDSALEQQLAAHTRYQHLLQENEAVLSQTWRPGNAEPVKPK